MIATKSAFATTHVVRQVCKVVCKPLRLTRAAKAAVRVDILPKTTWSKFIDLQKLPCAAIFPVDDVICCEGLARKVGKTARGVDSGRAEALPVPGGSCLTHLNLHLSCALMSSIYMRISVFAIRGGGGSLNREVRVIPTSTVLGTRYLYTPSRPPPHTSSILRHCVSTSTRLSQFRESAICEVPRCRSSA